MRRHARVDGA